MASVSRAYDLSVRMDKLTFAHHAVAMAAVPEERLDWLARAEREEWSVSQLRAASRGFCARINCWLKQPICGGEIMRTSRAAPSVAFGSRISLEYDELRRKLEAQLGLSASKLIERALLALQRELEAGSAPAE